MVIACTRDCYDTCIFDGSYRPLSNFPISGFTCSRGISDLKRNDRNRVTSPLLEGKEVDLERGLSYVERVIRTTPRERFLHIDYDGNQGLLTWYFPSRLWNYLGVASTDYSICSAEGHGSISAHYGSSWGALPEDFLKYDSFVLWGTEAPISFIHGWKLIKDRFKVVIDVRRSQALARSDLGIVIRPSSDVYLALGVLKELVGRVDPPDWLRGYSDLLRFLEGVGEREVESATGVPYDRVRELAGIYEGRRPLTVIGFALGRTFRGGDAIGLISLIPALLGMKRGFYYSNSQGLGIDFSYLRGLHGGKPSRVIGMAEVGEAVVRGEVDAIYVWNSNPIHSLPGSDRLLEAVEEGKVVLITHDPFMTETAKVSNVVIPALTFLEKEDVVYGYWHDYLIYNTPIKRGTGVSEVALMRELAKRLSVDSPVVWEDPWEAVRRATGVDIEELRKRGFVKLGIRAQDRGFVDVNPLPRDLETSGTGYLVFSSHPNFTNSQFTEVYGTRRPEVYNSSIEGEGYMCTEYGRVRVVFRRDPSVPEGVYFMYKTSLFDLDGKPINSLIGPERGEFGGTPRLNGHRVRVLGECEPTF